MPNHSIKMIKLRQVFGFTSLDMAHVPYLPHLVFPVQPIRKYLCIFNESSLSLKELLCKDDATLFDFFGLGPQLDVLSALLPNYAKRLRKRGVTRKTLYSEYIKCYPQGYSYSSFNRFLRAYMASHNSLFKDFDACGLPANHSAKGLEFLHMAKVVSQMVWSFRTWRKSFPEWFGVSAHGESYFPNGLDLVVAKIWKYSSKVVMPARVRKPKDKALVEDAVKLTYARIYPKLKEEDRDSLETLNQAIRSALEKHNNMILTERTYSRRGTV